MWRYRIGIGILVLIVSGMLGCATVPMAPSDLDRAAKQFQPPQDAAHLYVVRSGEYFGAAILFQVIVDGKVIGGIAPKTYLFVPLSIGQHTIAATSNENQASLALTAAPGQNYFVQVIPRWGWVTGRVGLEAIDADAGREAVLATSRAQGF